MKRARDSVEIIDLTIDEEEEEVEVEVEHLVVMGNAVAVVDSNSIAESAMTLVRKPKHYLHSHGIAITLEHTHKFIGYVPNQLSKAIATALDVYQHLTFKVKLLDTPQILPARWQRLAVRVSVTADTLNEQSISAIDFIARNAPDNCRIKQVHHRVRMKNRSNPLVIDIESNGIVSSSSSSLIPRIQPSVSSSSSSMEPQNKEVEIFSRAFEDLQAAYDIIKPVDADPALVTKLMEYQKIGLAWMIEREKGKLDSRKNVTESALRWAAVRGGILADEVIYRCFRNCIH
jgi:hypothetical protein